MTAFDELDAHDALGLAELIWKGEVSPEEVCEASIRKIEELNPEINAVVTPMFDLARERVRDGLPTGPLRGVPMLLKDTLAPYTGVRYTRGSRAYEHHIAGHDSELVRRYEAAGLVVVGRTNTPEFALHATTEPELHGPTRNPWNLDHSAGGSSGGSAAAVACGMAPLASGNDMGGSIRIPASWCGLFGFKPSRGRNPTGPVEGEIWLGLGCEHVLTRSVRDSAALLDLSCGEDAGAPYFLPRPEQSYLGAIENPPVGLRIAFSSESPIDTRVDLECIQAVEDAARMLESLGHTVEEAKPDVDGWAAATSWLTICFSEVAAEIDRLQAVLGRKARPSDVEAPTWTMALLGRAHTAGELNRAIEYRNRIGRIMGRFHQTYDVFLSPTTAQPPPKIGELLPRGADRMMMKLVNALGAGRLLKASGITRKLAEEGLAPVPFTQLANSAGQPAASLPLHWTPAGLPCGAMITAPIGDDVTVLRLAAQIERAQPWIDRKPGPRDGADKTADDAEPLNP